MTSVLVADIDRDARRTTIPALRYAGYTVDSARTLRQARAALRRVRPSAIMVDPQLAWPDEAPADVVSDLRSQTEVPIFVLSQAAGEVDKVVVLDAGADDYLTKPFGIEELLARLRVALRRVASPTTPAAPMVTEDFNVDVADRRWVRRDGSEVRLSPTEWRVVEVLISRAGRLVPQADLLTAVWGPKAVDRTHYLRVQMAGIRRKVEPDPSHPRYFLTAAGLGHRFDPSPWP